MSYLKLLYIPYPFALIQFMRMYISLFFGLRNGFFQKSVSNITRSIYLASEHVIKVFSEVTETSKMYSK